MKPDACLIACKLSQFFHLDESWSKRLWQIRTNGIFFRLSFRESSQMWGEKKKVHHGISTASGRSAMRRRVTVLHAPVSL